MAPRILIYLLRRDLRLADNPIFHEISKLHSQSQAPFTHVLPLYVFPAQQIDVSGFLADPSSAKSPYPEARSQVGGFWRCGHHRSKFIAESVWDLKESLEKVGSGMEVRVGMLGDVVRHVLDGFGKQGAEVSSVWMTEEVGVEEKREERDVKRAVEGAGAKLQLWVDEKYLVDDRDIPFQNPRECPDVFTSYKKMVEPLRDAPRRVLPTPTSLPPLPPNIPPQAAPFAIPSTLEGIISALHKPLSPSLDLKHPPTHPSNAHTAIPFRGGETSAHTRLDHLLASGAMTRYKDTRNGMLGADFSSKLSAFLALGSLTARQTHWAMSAFEDGTSAHKGAQGHGKGETKGSTHMRFELLWRDYMRLCARKFGPRLFRASGFRADTSYAWKADAALVERWAEGATGTGLVDASQRELFLTGYTSNRARQNVASFLAKHLGVDWRVGAEWYECCLVDYDVASNWGNWQYTAGVGNDPREGGGGRKFNPVKQASDYDGDAAYCKTWVAEVRGVARPEQAWQCWTVPEGERAAVGLAGVVGAEKPLVKIDWKSRGGGYSGGGRRGGGGGGDGGRGGRGRGGRGKGRGSGRDGFSKRQEA